MILGRGPKDPMPPATQRWAVKLDFFGSNPNVRPVGVTKGQATISYFKGRPDQWQAGLATYTRIRYPELWPGIDLVYSGQVYKLKCEFVVQPGADPARIQLASSSASAVRLTADGQLEVTTPMGGCRDAAPVAYQVKHGQRMAVAMSYVLDPTEAATYGYSFQLGSYHSSLPLVLDPAVLVYVGYIGGVGDDRGYSIAVDGAGNAYVTGYTASNQTTFPVTVGPNLIHNGTLTISIGTITSNTAGQGGGIAARGGSDYLALNRHNLENGSYWRFLGYCWQSIHASFDHRQVLRSTHSAGPGQRASNTSRRRRLTKSRAIRRRGGTTRSSSDPRSLNGTYTL